MITDTTNSIVIQIENYAKQQDVVFSNSEKVELSKDVKKQLQKVGNNSIDKEYTDKWVNLFNLINEDIIKVKKKF